MWHKSCGGKVMLDAYTFSMPAHKCTRCGRKIERQEDVVYGSDAPRKYRVRYSNARREWMATIYRSREDGVIQVLVVGCEDSAQAAKAWALGSMQLMEATGHDHAAMADKYDRMGEIR